MCGFIEPCIILEVDTYAFNRTHADWWFFSYQPFNYSVTFNYQIIEKLASNQSNTKYLGHVLGWWSKTRDSSCSPIMRFLSEETSKWVHRCVDVVTAGKAVRENMTEHCLCTFWTLTPFCPQAACGIFSGQKNNSLKSNATQPSTGWEFWSNMKLGISLN